MGQDSQWGIPAKFTRSTSGREGSFPQCPTFSILMLSLLFLVATTKHKRLQDPPHYFIKGKKHMRNTGSFSSWTVQ